MKRVIGIDPGFGRTGIGIIEGEYDKWSSVFYTCIETSKELDFVDRIKELSDKTKEIITKYQPDYAAVEELFFFKNVNTAINVAQARGVLLLALREAGIPVAEMTPLQVKQAVVGYGRAEKAQVQKMIAILLNIKKKAIQDDAADALAVALTHALSLKRNKIQ